MSQEEVERKAGWLVVSKRDGFQVIRIDREKILTLSERFGITPEACALIILRGVQQNKAIIVVTGLAKILWALQRISPAAIRWMMRKNLGKSRKEMRIED